MKTIYELMHNMDWERCHPAAIKVDLIEEFSNHRDWYCGSTMPFPFNPREMIISRYDTYGDNYCTLIGFSIVRNDVPINKKMVRAYVHLAACVLKKIENLIEINYYLNVDSKGKVPVLFSNLVWKAIITNMAQLRKLNEKRMKERKIIS